MKRMVIGCGVLAALGFLGIVALVVIGLVINAREPSQGTAAKPTAPTAPKPTATAVMAPTSAPAAPPKLGQGVILTTPGGLRLVVTANAVLDPAPSENQFNKPQGRWVVVDWTVKNEGQSDQQVSESWLKLITESGYVVESGNHAGHREPAFPAGVLGPGQLGRGFLAYDTPTDQRVKAVVFQSPGNRQFVIADLSQ